MLVIFFFVLRADFWIQDGYWNSIKVNPQSLEEPPQALEEMRKKNEQEKRDKERTGPGVKKKEPTETPDERFNKAFQRVMAGEGIERREPQRPEHERSLLWYKRVSTYTQRNLYDATMLLTEMINDYPSNHEEVLRLIHELLCRLGSFFLSPAPASILDISRYRMQVAQGHDLYTFNRAWKVWCAAYFYELVQRVHHASYIGYTRLDISALPGASGAALETLVKHLKERIVGMCHEMGQLDFFKLYRVSADECYAFPGDACFSRYLHPQGAVNRGDVLTELHPDRQAVRFFSEAKVRTETILHNMLQARTHMARVCILNVLDRYFFMDGIQWRAGAVIDQVGIELSITKIIDSTIPCLVAPMSDFYAHYNLSAYRGETLYHTIVVWLLLIRHYKQGYFYRSDITKHINFLLGFDQQQQQQQPRNGPRDDYAELDTILSGNNSFVIRRI